MDKRLNQKPLSRLRNNQLIENIVNCWNLIALARIDESFAGDEDNELSLLYQELEKRRIPERRFNRYMKEAILSCIEYYLVWRLTLIKQDNQLKADAVGYAYRLMNEKLPEYINPH